MRRRRLRMMAAVVVAAATLLGASFARAACSIDLQGADDEPGQKDMSQFCLVGACGGSSTEVSWSLDDTEWPGNNTGDACALFDTDADGNADRAVCVTVEDDAQMQAGNPKCYTCTDTRPDRCTGGTLVACTSTCSVTLESDPFQLVPSHIGNACGGTNCRTLDAQSNCCLTATDSGGGVLIDACSYPSQQPNSDPSDCVTSRECSKQNPDDPACADDNPCTVDSCDTTFGVCRHAPGNAGAVCRSAAGVCDAAETCTGSSATCPPDGFATGGICRNASGLCDVAESCDGSSADCPADGVKPSGTVCRTATGGVCDVAEVCDGTNADCPADGSAPNTTPCNDGDACTTGDHCDGAGGCVGGPPLVCTDNNPCTDNGCNPATGCTVVNNSDPCDDDNACTDPDRCEGGLCVGGPEPDCNDHQICTDDTCDPASGCEHTNNSAPCDDGNACTSDDACAGGSCQGGPPTNCNDNNDCTLDSCDTQDGCQHEGITDCCNENHECADTDACTTNERCVDHACVSDPVVCNDNNGCTNDRCDPVDGCTFIDNTDPCNDDNACTVGDTCTGGSCVGSLIDCRDGNVCTDDSCDPESGCVNAANSAQCNDDDNCTTVDVCVNKVCVGSVPPNCDDDNACTDDVCVPPGGCVSTNNSAGCSDGDPCTENDTCVEGSCGPGPRKDCNDLNGCTDDTCNSTTGQCQYVFNDDPCSDGNLCTEDDICFQGACQSGGEKDCNDTLFCTDDSCAPNGDCVHTPREDEDCCDFDAQCEDTDHCTINERCVDNQCVSDPRNCNDNNHCTIDSCDSDGGGFACEQVPCYLVDGSDCPPECQPPPECGDGVVEGPETCDPPGSSTQFPGKLCREDCTFCGDGITQTVDGETCDDANHMEGCIKNDSFPVDACKNDCTLHVCRDPTKAVLASYIDKFTFHGRLMAASTVDFASQDFQVELTTLSGKILYRTSVAAGAIASVSGTSGGPFKYVSKTAKLEGGTAKVKIRRQGDAYRATVQGYGNLLASQPDMVTHIRSGGTEWTVHGSWVRRSPRVWRFYPATAD